MSRRGIPLLGAAATLTAAGGVAFYANRVERTRVQLDRFTLRVDKPGLPPQGLTILHLSDFHFRAGDSVQERRLERLRRLLLGRPYDILALTGDLIHDEAGLPAALAFLGELHPRLGAFTVPGNRDYWKSSFLAVLGTPEERAGLSPLDKLRLALAKMVDTLRVFLRNERARLRVHANDVPAMNRALAASGVQPLVNRSVHVEGEGVDVWLAGVDDLTQGRPDLDAALAGIPLDRPLVLLAHNPDAWLDPRAGTADLVLSGHTHGGQVRAPGLGALYRQGTHLPQDRPAGWFERGGSALFVSRGLGESFPFRLGARPQAALIRLVPPSRRIAAKRRTR